MFSLYRPTLFGLIAALAAATSAHAAGFTIERSITLPETTGRIDHIAADLEGRRLFVAEHDNGTLDVVNLATGEVSGRVADLADPQGVAYLADTDQVVVANGGDGSLRFFDATTLLPGPKVELGGDADNVRIAPPRTRQVIVGYGGGGLANIKQTDGSIVSKVELGAHPESFQLSADGATAYVNLPDAGQIGIVDLNSGTVSGFATPDLGGNFPMALEGDTGRLAVGFRSPAKLGLVEPAAKTIVTVIDTCADADDLFFDVKRSLLYLICGAGVVEVVQQTGDKLASVAKIPTGAGARTGLFVPSLDRLFVAAPERNGEDARILVLKPDP